MHTRVGFSISAVDFTMDVTAIGLLEGGNVKKRSYLLDWSRHSKKRERKSAFFVGFANYLCRDCDSKKLAVTTRLYHALEEQSKGQGRKKELANCNKHKLCLGKVESRIHLSSIPFFIGKSIRHFCIFHTLINLSKVSYTTVRHG